MSTPLLTVGNFRTVTEENELLRVSCTVSEGNSSDTDLWFEVSGLPPASTIDTADAFLAPCLLFALKRHSSIHFNVPISDCLVQQADDIAHIFGIQLGLNTKLAIKFSHITIVERKQRGGITGFSAGVDSWFSLKKNLLDLPESSKKLTHLLVNDVGANTSEHKKEQVLRQAEKAAGKFNLGLVGVNSNMSAFLSMNFQQTHTARNASTAHLLSSICDTFYYSSTDTYTEAGVFPTYDMAYADTILLSLLSSDAIALRSTGSAFSRAEKTHEILDVPDIGENLDVCVNHRHAGPKINCGYCWKCLRTEVTLEAFDVLSHFEPVFDLDAYRRRRWTYLREISLSKKPTEREAFDLALGSGLVGPKLLVQIQGVFVLLVRRMVIGRFRNALRSWLSGATR